MPALGLLSFSVPPKGIPGQIRGKLTVAALTSAGKQGLGGAAVKVAAGLGVGILRLIRGLTGEGGYRGFYTLVRGEAADYTWLLAVRDTNLFPSQVLEQ